MKILSTTPSAPKAPATLHVCPKFDRVLFDCNGKQLECSVKTAIFELKRSGRTLADVLLVDLESHLPEGPHSRQCEAVRDALLASGLPDPAFTAGLRETR